MSDTSAASAADPSNTATENRESSAPQRRAAVIGLGMIGGSIALALRNSGWHVVGDDVDSAIVEAAVSGSVIDAAATADLLGPVELTFIATPAGSIVDAAKAALAATSGLVTDAGSVKSAIVADLAGPRFIGGHPMAGSERSGLEGASATMFDNAVWVLCPAEGVDNEAFSTLRDAVTGFGADVVVLDAGQHDELVAMVSHVPHLTAATMMRLATERSTEHRSLLRLAAGGFRDMTRIAAGAPDIWIDIANANADAIVRVLDDLIGALQDVRQQVATNDNAALLSGLTDARSARINLPSEALDPSALSEVRIPIDDQPGELVRVLSLAGELAVNVFDIEIAHTAERRRGVVIVVVAAESAALFEGGLIARGFAPRVKDLS